MTPADDDRDDSLDSPLWTAIADALAELEARGDLVVHGTREQVVEALARRLLGADVVIEGSALPRMTAERFAAFLERAAIAGTVGDEWQQHVGTRHANPHVEEARRQAVMIAFRVEQGNLAPAQASDYLRVLARGLRDRAG